MLNNNFNNNFLEDEESDDEQINSSTAGTAAQDFTDPLAEVVKSVNDVGYVPANNENKNHKEMNCKIVGLTASIPSFEEKHIEGKNVVIYQVQIGFQKNQRSWVINKRYSDFDALDKSIKEVYANLPSLPAKTLFKISDKKQIEDRKVILNSYLKEIINRKDMRTCVTFRKFIDLESNFPVSKMYQAERIGLIKDFSKGVRDFIYLPEFKTAFVA
jgi:hypothetical protein